jgi:transposase
LIASSVGAVIQQSISSRVVKMTGIAFGWIAPTTLFGSVVRNAKQRIGVEATGTYGVGLLRYMQQAGIEVLEVTTPDKHDRRKRDKNDDLDAQNAAHAAFAGRRTVTPKSRDGMIESLRVLKAYRKTAVAARRIALQMIHNTIVCAPDGAISNWMTKSPISTR